MNNPKNRFLLYISAILLVMVIGGILQGALNSNDKRLFEEGWQSYGTDDGTLRADQLSGLGWSEYKFDTKAVEAGNRYVWFRSKLPDFIEEETYMQLYLNDNALEIYLDGARVYEFGDMNQTGDRVAYGSPFHMLKIPRSAEGKYIYIRMHAFYAMNAGIIRHCYLDTHEAILKSIFKNDIDDMLISFILVVAALVLIIAFFSNGTRITRASFYLAFASFITGLWMFSETSVKQLLYNNPRFWLYVAFITFFLLPIGYIKYSVELFAEDRFKRHLNLLAITNVVCLVLALLMDRLEIKNIIYTLNPYLFLMVFEMVALLVTILLSARKGNKYAALFVVGFAVTCIFALYDMLGLVFHLVPWTAIRISYGMFIFLFVLVLILVSHIQDMYNQEAESALEILAKNQELEALNTELEENKQHLIEVNSSLEKTVQERTESLQALLDNAGQGFLMFDQSMRIDSCCSSECERIFDRDVKGVDYGELVCENDPDQRNFLRNILQTTLQLKDDSYNDKYLSLLPSEIIYRNKMLELKYRVIKDKVNEKDNRCMVVITDITSTRLLSKRMEEEEAHMKNIVKVAAYTRDFVELTDSFRYFVSTAVPELFESKNLILSKVTILRKKIHYYKGSFGIFGFRDMLEALNNLEMALKEMESDESLTLEKLISEYQKYNLLIELNEIMNFVSKTLSMEFKDRIDTVRVNRKKVCAIASRVDEIPGGEECAEELRQLTYRDFFVLLAKYVVFTENLAERLGKSIEHLKIEGGNFLVDTEKYEHFTNSLVHVFRNAVDHGIESEVERIKRGKKAAGYISCIVELKGDRIGITIEDDGNGIDYQALRRKALEEGLIKAGEGASDEHLMGMVLKGKLSSRDEASEISGFGLGVSVVAEEVEKLGGTMGIESAPEKYTRINIDIPYFS